MLTEKEAIEVMKCVMDPEIGVDIHTLGLIYGIQVEDDKIGVTMTFTSPMCPFGPEIVKELREKLMAKGFKEATIDLTFEPPWEPSEELREMLGV